MYSKDEKYHIIKFFFKYGLNPTLEAFGISKATLYRYRHKYITGHYSKDNLNDKSRKPRNARRSETHPLIIQFIQQQRLLHLGLGKDKLKVLVDQYCKSNPELNLKSISKSTIGRIIKRLKQSHSIPILKPSTKVTLNGATGKLHVRTIRNKQKKLRREDYKPEQPGDLVQIDTVITILNGTRRYVINAVDLVSRMTFSYAYKTLSSNTGKDFLIKMRKYYPFEVKRIQTDNGLEFHKHFMQYLSKEEIIQYFNYPRSPKMNAYIERFNRTIQEEFMFNRYWDLKDNIDQFNQDLTQYLEWYNSTRPHAGIDYKTPYQILQQYQINVNTSVYSIIS